MKSKLIRDDIEKVFVLVLDTGDEVMDSLRQFAVDQNLTAAHFTAIGALSDVKLAFFDTDKKEYKHIPIDHQVEVLSLMGNVAKSEGKPKIHAHIVVGKPDGTAHGGHLVSGHVRPTLEIVLTQTPKYLRRRSDPATGLALIDPDAN